MPIRQGYGKIALFAFAVACSLSLDAAIDLFEKGGAYTVGTDDLQTDFTNSGNTTATLTFEGEATYHGVIAGDIRVVKNKSGKLTFANVNTFTGGIAVNGGSVACGVSGALGSGLVEVASECKVEVTDQAVCVNAIHFREGRGYLALGEGGGTYAGDISGDSGVTIVPTTVTQGDVNHVTGSISIPNGTVSMPDGQARVVHFHGPVSVATIVQNSAYHRTAPSFHSTENAFGCLMLKREQSATKAPYFGAGSMPHECCITGLTANVLNVVDFEGAQIVRHVSATDGNRIALNAMKAGALTLTDPSNGPYVLFNGDMDLTFSPTDGGYWTLTNGTSTMTGVLTVSNATMTVDLDASFKKLTKVVIEDGARLRVHTRVANAFSALTDATVRGTLEIGGMVSSPFPDSGFAMRIENGGRLNVSAGVSISIPFLAVDGVYVEGGTYSKENCPWVEGDGCIIVANEGISSWADAVDGLWSEGGKWVSKSVPESGKVFVTANGSDYTVTLDSPTLDPETTLIGNADGYTTTVAVLGDVSLGTSASSVEVLDGGVFDVREGVFTSSNTQGKVCKVVQGGVWRVSGGTCNFRTKGSSFCVADGGRLEISAGTMSLEDIMYGYASPFNFSNGIIDITGGTLRLVNNQGEFNPLGSGEIAVGGTGILSIARGWMGPKTAGQRLHITTSGEGLLAGDGVLCFGDTLTGGETLIELNSTTAGKFGFEAIIGCNRACRVQVNVNSGATFSTGGYGLRIGTRSQKKDSLPCCPTGIVNVVSGTCAVTGEWYGPNYGDAGTHIGGALDVVDAYTCHYYGEMNLSESAKYVQSRGVLGIGLSQGEGKVTVGSSSTLTKNGGGEVLIGSFGGKGTLSVDGGGKVLVSGNMFIGGIDKESLGSSAGYGSADFETTEAQGVVTVNDGDLTIGERLVIGERGAGTLCIGDGGIVSAKSIDMKDSVLSELVFRLGQGDVGPLVVADEVAISPQARIRVDLTGRVGALRRIMLIRSQEISGTFGADNVVILGVEGATLAYRADGLYVRGPVKGLAVCIR